MKAFTACSLLPPCPLGWLAPGHSATQPLSHSATLAEGGRALRGATPTLAQLATGPTALPSVAEAKKSRSHGKRFSLLSQILAAPILARKTLKRLLIKKCLPIGLIFCGSISIPGARASWIEDIFEGGTGGGLAGGLEFCNYSSSSYINVAYGYYKTRGTGWVSDGWYRINKGACSYVISVPLRSRTYYYRATGSNGSVWEGDAKFCAPSSAFTDWSMSDCSDSSKKGFRKINVGSAYDYTLTLR